MRFVDRKEEKARLEATLAGAKPTFTVIYGRRRLGKSTLMKNVLSDNDVYYLADRTESNHQLTLLAKVLAEIFPDIDKVTYPDWETLLRTVNYRTQERFTLCIESKT